MKRLFDLAIVLISLPILMPLFLVLVCAVRLTGKQVLFSHRRVGLKGKEFECYKFRSMVPNAQELLKEYLEQDKNAKLEWEQTFKLKNDPRITPVGKLLRKTSLDEIPQLLNVIKGEMSLVGPRPVIKEELVKYYGGSSKDYISVRPGLTGPWQASGRNDTSYEERVKMDSEYARNHSFLGDIIILLKTIKIVLMGKGAY